MENINSLSLDFAWRKFEDYWKNIIQEVKIEEENEEEKA